ncbi:hypothetical protein F8388_018568, partial [Cannabis sativa]
LNIMNKNQLQRQVALMRSSLIEQGRGFQLAKKITAKDNICILVLHQTIHNMLLNGYLDEQQFLQLEDLQDDANPNFVEEIVTLFYKDSHRLFHNIEQALKSKPIDFTKLDNYMHQFRGSNSSIGAMKVKNECNQFKEFCLAGNAEGCIRAFQRVKQEHETLRMQLETYFKNSM